MGAMMRGSQRTGRADHELMFEGGSFDEVVGPFEFCGFVLSLRSGAAKDGKHSKKGSGAGLKTLKRTADSFTATARLASRWKKCARPPIMMTGYLCSRVALFFITGTGVPGRQ